RPLCLGIFGITWSRGRTAPRPNASIQRPLTCFFARFYSFQTFAKVWSLLRRHEGANLVRDLLYTETFLRTVRQWDGSLLSPSSENRRVEGIEVFRNSWIERYVATAHPIMPGVWWGPVFGFC